MKFWLAIKACKRRITSLLKSFGSRRQMLDLVRTEKCEAQDFVVVNRAWLTSRLETILSRLESLERKLQQSQAATVKREYYSVPEFASIVERSEYCVREWCRLSRINAVKSESGRGDAKHWKIPVVELQRYLDHGLLPF